MNPSPEPSLHQQIGDIDFNHLKQKYESYTYNNVIIMVHPYYTWYYTHIHVSIAILAPLSPLLTSLHPCIHFHPSYFTLILMHPPDRIIITISPLHVSSAVLYPHEAVGSDLASAAYVFIISTLHTHHTLKT